MSCEIGCRVKESLSDRREGNESVMIRKFPLDFSWMEAIRHWYMAVSSAVETETKSGKRYDLDGRVYREWHDVLLRDFDPNV